MTHPRGIYTLFFTEMWERFSYYGMRALLMLFMVDSAAGLKLSDQTAGAVYGLYTAIVYLAALPGGWVGDQLLGKKAAVWWGGVIIAIGHVLLGLSHGSLFYLGLLVIALGSGLLKSNMSALVGELYPQGGGAKDAGYTLFYMGINLGALMGPLLCGWLAQQYGWAVGFSAAAVGMGLGLLQFKLSQHHLTAVGAPPQLTARASRKAWLQLMLSLGVLALVAVLASSGVITLNAQLLAKWTSWLTLALAGIFFVHAYFRQGLDSNGRRRLGMIFLIFAMSVIFWAGFEQIGSIFSIIAERYTQRQLGSYTVPAAWFQSVNPVLVILLAPLIASLWLWLARRKLEPSLPAKFAAAMLLLAAGFAVAYFGMKAVAAHGTTGPSSLLITIFALTVAELCLSPVSLSAVSKLAPPHLVSRFMGVFFLGSSLGNNLAGTLGGEVASLGPQGMGQHFFQVVWISAASGLLVLGLTPWLKRLMAGAQ
jgi:proton-dependent oligopeptide transporter, POT family